MKSFIQQKQKANDLRKAGQYNEALTIYEELWGISNDHFVGAGLLHCLRKQKEYEIALEYISQLKSEYLELDWFKNEVIWTYIEGDLLQGRGKDPMGETLNAAKRILDLNPNDIALQKVVFQVLKVAKEANKWNVIKVWIEKVNPDQISNEPIQTPRGAVGWTKKSLWYYYKINSLLKSGQHPIVIEMTNTIKGMFPQPQERFFIRLQALSYYQLGDFSKAEEIYSKLCRHEKTDWWLLYEYAKAIKSQGNYHRALELMYRAVATGRKWEAMVTLIYDIGLVCKELDKKEEAFYHILLTKLIREQNQWNVSGTITNLLEILSQDSGVSCENQSFKLVLNQCRKYWFNHTNKTGPKKKIRKALKGKVLICNNNAPFCFIKKEDESFFCFKSDIPGEIIENQEVQFDAIESYDKKKKRDSWKAINISLI
ncbi:tetratricopeptide repeat protein [Bacillus sp. BR3(2024)]|uniref:tetratricopeptide repeat protein n=1 Tax=Bacillus sp. BR3(2024) TaxID=3126755 RepID=UPI00318430F8